jgi:hypothetical protein
VGLVVIRGSVFSISTHPLCAVGIAPKITEEVRKVTSEIDWNLDETTEAAPVNLRDAEMEREYSFTFDRVFQTNAGGIGAEVRVEGLDGSLLWLKGEYGPSNGLMSLIKLVGDPDNIEGKTITYVRVESEKSPVGYAHSWRL